MDREVAAGWFDYMMIGKDMEFSNYLHNIPVESTDSNRSSHIPDSNMSSLHIPHFYESSLLTSEK